MNSIAVPLEVLTKIAEVLNSHVEEQDRLEKEVSEVKTASARPDVSKPAEALVDVLIEKNLMKNAADRKAKIAEYVNDPAAIFRDFEKFATKIEVQDVPAVGAPSGVKTASASENMSADQRLATRVLGAFSR